MPRSDPACPRASVIIPVHNGEVVLEACLTALAGQLLPAACIEVIVVDDGSADGSADVAVRHGATVIRQQQSGAAAARNRGARAASGTILLFTDADCEAEPDWVAQMLAPFADPQVAGVKGTCRTRQRSLVARFTQVELEEKHARLARAPGIDFVDTRAAAYRRSVFLANRGFDTRFLIDEDQELSYRLSKLGHRIVFAPKAVVYHRHPASLWEYSRRKVPIGRWKVAVHARHPAKAVSDSYTPCTQKAQLGLLPLAGVTWLLVAFGLAPRLVATVPTLLGALSTVPLTARAAHRGWELAVVTPALLLVRALSLDLGLALGAWQMISAGLSSRARRGHSRQHKERHIIE